MVKYKTLITLGIYDGMQRGELTILTWNDIQFDNRLTKIDKSLQHLPEKDTFVKSTKTQNTRVISIHSSAIKLLKEYKKWQNKKQR